jgi:hypothetical protein
LYQRLKFAQTAAALKRVPSWNLIPRRRLNVYVLPSREILQVLASIPVTEVLPSLS